MHTDFINKRVVINRRHYSRSGGEMITTERGTLHSYNQYIVRLDEDGELFCYNMRFIECMYLDDEFKE